MENVGKTKNKFWETWVSRILLETCQQNKTSGPIYCDRLKAAQLRAPTTVSGVKQAVGRGVEGQVDLDDGMLGTRMS